MEYILSEIQPIRRKLGITQSELARLAGVSQSLIAKIEKSNIDPTFSNAVKIFDALSRLSKKEERPVSEIMNKDVVVIKSDDTIEQSIRKMKEFEISQLPVVDENNNPIGFISENIILEALMNNAPKEQNVTEIMQECPPIVSHESSVKVASTLLKYYPIVLVYQEGMLKGIITKSDIIINMYE